MSDNHKNYSLVVDILRVAAMIGVLAVHFAHNFPINIFFKSILTRGANCVQIFFVISAYLACLHYFKQKSSIIEYYKRRAIRILPTYYTAVFIAMIYVCIFTSGYNQDIYHLGWLRYFLALNTLIPSVDFWQWNNAFGFWSMTNFFFFYAIFPFLTKIINSFYRSILFFIFTLIIAVISVETVQPLLPNNCSYPQVFISWSPLGQMQHFALGITVYFGIKEMKKNHNIIFLILLAMFPPSICSTHLLFSILTCLFIICIGDDSIDLHDKKLCLLKLTSKYSFSIYLTHVLGLTIGSHIAKTYCPLSTIQFYATKLVVACISTIIFCIILELVQHVSNDFFLRKNKILSPSK